MGAQQMIHFFKALLCYTVLFQVQVNLDAAPLDLKIEQIQDSDIVEVTVQNNTQETVYFTKGELGALRIRYGEKGQTQYAVGDVVYRGRPGFLQPGESDLQQVPLTQLGSKLKPNCIYTMRLTWGDVDSGSTGCVVSNLEIVTDSNAKPTLKLTKDTTTEYFPVRPELRPKKAKIKPIIGLETFTNPEVRASLAKLTQSAGSPTSADEHRSDSNALQTNDKTLKSNLSGWWAVVPLLLLCWLIVRRLRQAA